MYMCPKRNVRSAVSWISRMSTYRVIWRAHIDEIRCLLIGTSVVTIGSLRRIETSPSLAICEVICYHTPNPHVATDWMVSCESVTTGHEARWQTQISTHKNVTLCQCLSNTFSERLTCGGGATQRRVSDKLREVRGGATWWWWWWWWREPWRHDWIKAGIAKWRLTASKTHQEKWSQGTHLGT